MNDINITMGIIFVASIAVFLLLHWISKNMYSEMIAPLNKEEYKLKDIIHIGLFIMEKINYKYSSNYDRNLISKVAEISGHRYAEYYRTIHFAHKVSFLIIVAILLMLIGIFTAPDINFLIISATILALIFYQMDKELYDKVKKRRVDIQLEFPMFLNKLMLLVNTGIPVTMAWEKIINDNRKQGPLYKELEVTMGDIKSGRSEIHAYEEFAKRCRLPEISKFVSLLLQNLRKGNGDFTLQLRIMINECWEIRKHVAKRLGEEASTKLLIPMMIMMFALLILLGLPAYLSITSIGI